MGSEGVQLLPSPLVFQPVDPEDAALGEVVPSVPLYHFEEKQVRVHVCECMCMCVCACVCVCVCVFAPCCFGYIERVWTLKYCFY